MNKAKKLRFLPFKLHGAGYLDGVKQLSQISFEYGRRARAAVLIALILITPSSHLIGPLCVSLMLSQPAAAVFWIATAGALASALASSVLSRAVTELTTRMTLENEPSVRSALMEVSLGLTIESRSTEQYRALEESVRARTFVLAGAFWNVVSFLSALIAVIVGLTALVSINPYFLLLSITGFFPIVAIVLARKQLVRAFEVAAGDRRMERRLHDSVIAAKHTEILFRGGMALISNAARGLWTSAGEAQSKGHRRFVLYAGVGWLSMFLSILFAMNLMFQPVGVETPPVATLALIVGFLVQLSSYFSTLSNGLSSIVEGVALMGRFGRLRSMLRRESMVTPRTSEAVVASEEGISLAFENVTYTYPGASCPTLRNVSFQVREGETLFVVGLNGAGKSTLANLALGILSPESGAVRWGHGVSPHDGETVGALFQNVSALPLSEGDSVRIGRLVRPADRSEVETKLDLADRLLNGRDRATGSRGGAVRAHDEQMTLARALLRDRARFMILDEPVGDTFSYLVASLADVEYPRRTHAPTKLVVTHDLNSIPFEGHVVVLKDGVVACEGEYSSLIANSSDMRSMLGL